MADRGEKKMANQKSISTQFPRALGKKEILAGSTSLNPLKHFFLKKMVDEWNELFKTDEK